MISSKSSGYAKVAAHATDDDGETATATTSLDENLIAVPPAAMATSTVPMLQITAPENLPEGYEMDAAVGGDGTAVIKVKVPQGGIEKGQTFSVPFPAPLQLPSSTIHVPVGAWRDGFFDIFHYGICHPHCWTASCCTTLAAGQVMSRLGLDWTGKPARTTGQATTTFFIMVTIVCVYYVVRIPLATTFWIVVDDDERQDDETGDANGADVEEQEDEDGDLVSLLIMIWFCIFWVIMGVVLTRVRASVRARYGIPPSFLGDQLDDPVLSCCCCCFTAGQMLRHTTDYETYPATCCTRTGVPPTAPLLA